MAATHFTAEIDQATLSRAKSVIAVRALSHAAIAIGLFVILLVLWSTIGVPWWVNVIAIVLILPNLAGIYMALAEKRKFLNSANAGPTALHIDQDGIEISNLPKITWDNLAGMSLVESAPSADTKQSSLDTVRVDLFVKDGKAYQTQLRSEGFTHRMFVYPKWPDGLQRASIPFYLHRITTIDKAKEGANLLLDQAQEREIPTRKSEQFIDILNWRGPVLESTWNTPHSQD